ncbi:hypothetical protein ACQEVB_29915 [Pseudonocardia sp. CA-107938]|uniref:hypothetical protein n=1 Tax=Pseudonocardia sp. CA-107938 TaxID=3240021 RepID=UPI003D90F5AF
MYCSFVASRQLSVYTPGRESYALPAIVMASGVMTGANLIKGTSSPCSTIVVAMSP